jgi:hypothetical protein
MPSLTRRGLFAVGGAGAASLAVAACGSEDDPRDGSSDADALDAAASAEAILGAVYKTADDAVARQLSQASSARVDELEKISGGPASASASVEDYPAGANQAQDAAIGAYRQLVRLGSTDEVRATGIKFLTQVSSEQAVVRGLQDDDQSPQPFVTGEKTPPYIASEEDTSTTTSTTSSSTTSTEGG